MKVAAVVCAYNEAPRIADVLETLTAVPELACVLVMDDGSSDGTAQVAQAVAGVTVFRTEQNQGKGAAMLAGICRAAALAGAVFFCDADLQGLKPAQVSGMIREYRRLGAAQVVGMSLYGLGGLSLLGGAAVTDIISGQRVVDTRVLAQVPATCWNGYSIETAINHTVDKLGGTTVLYPLQGMQPVYKEAKTGVLNGFKKNVGMFSNISATKRALKQGSLGCGTQPRVSDKALGVLSASASAGHYLLTGGMFA